MKFVLQRKSEQALRALRALADADQRMKAADLARYTESTVPYVAHVMRPLTAAGWVESHRGPTGGYRLTADGEGVSVLDVIDAVEGSVDTTSCVLRGDDCPSQDLCALHEAWTGARTALLAQLAGTAAIPQKEPNS